MQSTKQLPESYKEVYSLDLSKHIRAQLLLNAVALILMLVFAWFFIRINMLITSATWTTNLFSKLGSIELLVILVALLLMPLLHEAAHGFYFWWYTRQRPKFGLKLGYAYAAAPDWYIPTNQYKVVALAPFVILSLLGIALMPVTPASMFPALLLFLSLNAGGSVGDMFIVWKLTNYSANALVNDQGDSFTIFD